MHLLIGNKVYSSWSLRPWIVMRAHDIAFDETVIPLRTPETAALIKKQSPTGKVPCLTDNGQTVWESLAIMEYLAERFPDKAIWPRDVAARAHARSISSEMHAGFQNLRKHCPMVVTQKFAAKPLPTDVAADVERITAIWNEARANFADQSQGPFLYGAFSAADGMYAPVATRLYTYSIAVDAVSQAYIDAIMAHPAYQDWLTAAVAEPWIVQQNEGETPIEDLRARR
jgi:glutathione S-transferase